MHPKNLINELRTIRNAPAASAATARLLDRLIDTLENENAESLGIALGIPWNTVRNQIAGRIALAHKAEKSVDWAEVRAMLANLAVNRYQFGESVNSTAVTE